MSKAIVAFPQNRVSRSSALSKDIAAEIIIFPGVRFERLDDESPFEPTLSQDKTTRQMRTLFAQLLDS